MFDLVHWYGFYEAITFGVLWENGPYVCSVAEEGEGGEGEDIFPA